MIKQLLGKYRALSIQVKAGIWFFICSVIQKGIGFLTTPIFTRLMTTEQYGVYTVYQTWRDILAVIITFSLSSSVYMKKMIELDTQEEKDKLTCALQGLTTLISCIALIVYLAFLPFWNRILGLPTLAVLSIFVSALLTSAFDFWAARARISYKYRALVVVTLLTSAMKPILAITAIMQTTETAYARIYAVTVVEIAVYSVLYFINFKSRKKLFNKEYWKYGIVFVLPLIPHFLSQRVLSSSDRIMIERMVGKSEAGIYGLANSIGSILTIVVTSCDGVLAPWVYSKIKLDKNDNTQIQKVSLYIIILMAFLSLGVIAIAPELISIFAPAEYHEAIWTLPPLILSVFFMMVYMFFVYYEYYFEESKKIMIATMGSAILNIVLNYIFIGEYGYMAAGYTTLFCYISYTMFHYFVYRHVCRKHDIVQAPYNRKNMLLVSILALLFGFGMMALYNYPIIRFAVIFSIAFVAIVQRKRILEVYQQFKS